jgi:hypothetical protein
MLYTPTARPHILLLLADDWGSYDAGFRQRSLGRLPDVATPAIDALRAGGIFLSSYYVQPICTPTRASLLTGRFSSHTGSEHQLFGTSEPSCLPLELPLLPQCLAALGYQSHMVGKWHLGYPNASCAPWGRGFETYLGYLNGDEGYYEHGLAFATDFHFCRSKPGRSPNASSASEIPPGGCDPRVCHGRTGTYEGQYSTHVYTSRVQELLDGWAQASRDRKREKENAEKLARERGERRRAGGNAERLAHPSEDRQREDEEAERRRRRAGSGVAAAGATGVDLRLALHSAASMSPDFEAGSTAGADPPSADMRFKDALADSASVAQPSSADARFLDATRPLFIYVAWQAVHEPLQEPPPLSASREAALASLTAGAHLPSADLRSLEAVHEPLQEPPPLSASRQAPLPSVTVDPSRRMYVRMLAAMDEGIENITATLRRNAMLNSTVIVRRKGGFGGRKEREGWMQGAVLSGRQAQSRAERSRQAGWPWGCLASWSWVTPHHDLFCARSLSPSFSLARRISYTACGNVAPYTHTHAAVGTHPTSAATSLSTPPFPVAACTPSPPAPPHPCCRFCLVTMAG